MRSSGYRLSKSANPGASGIGPRTVSQILSKSAVMTGFWSHATAPAEYAASAANCAWRFGATKIILPSPPCSLISKAAKWPSNEGMSKDKTTNSGSNLIYSSTALSPS